jgi:peptide chain release factor 2
MLKDGFWESPKAKEVMRERARLEDLLTSWEALEREFEDTKVLFELALEEEDETTLKEVIFRLKELRKQVENEETKLFLSGKHDTANAIVTIHAGAGGTEAQDWVEMLLRMYLRWAEKRGYRTRIIDILAGEEAGIKSVTFTVEGPYAYGHLKAEAGIHRLVRISPFDANSRRHTSFASVFVYPEVNSEIEISVNPSDLRVDTYRASGAGGQHVNKTDSAVRITHIPTGIVTQCQNERSQHMNRENAMKILLSRLYQKKKEEEKRKLQELENSKKEIAWGSQIRSYVFHPYNLVKDHRTKVETSNTQDVMDGNIDPFIQSFLMKKV